MLSEDVDMYDDYTDYDKGYWTTRDGKRLDIREMETEHIQNTIKLLKRNISKVEDEDEAYKNYIEYKISELEKEIRIRIAYYNHIIGKGE